MTIIEAKMEGICGICGKKYAAGTRIVKDTKTNKWAEADCKFPDHARNKYNANSTNRPNDGTASKSRDSFSVPDPYHDDAAPDAELEARVAKRLKRAKGIVDAEFPDAKGYADYLSMVAEIAHELFAEAASMSIQKAKEHNLQWIAKR